MTASKSPERNTFQKNAYLERCAKEGKEPSQAYLKMWDDIEGNNEDWLTADHSNDLEWDLRTTDWILEKARTRESYAQNIYAALCNMRWQKLAVVPILTEALCSYSWRYAGGIVADMRQEGDYIDWYCSGMGGINREYEGDETTEQWTARTGYVPESHITEEIRADFQKLGWIPVPWPDDA